MKKIVILNGIHSSGKSTLARLLAKEDDAFAYYPEIGGQLRTIMGSNAMRSGEEFDKEVMQRELVRDGEILTCTEIPIVETWHIGNIAYVHARNRHLEKQYRAHLEEQLKRFRVYGLLVDISWETFRMRATERIAPSEMDELVNFYAHVLETTYGMYERYSIPHVTVRNEGIISDALQSARQFLLMQKLLA